MAKHDPSRKRGHFRTDVGRVRRRLKIRAAGAQDATECKTAVREMLGLEESVPAQGILNSLKAVAPMLWAPAAGYQRYRALEAAELSSHGIFAAALVTKSAAPQSTYTKRGLIRNPERKIEQIAAQACDMGAAAVRQANQQKYPFTICAKSVAKLARQTRTKDWKEETKLRHVLDKKTTQKLVELMMQCKPGVDFAVSDVIVWHVFDQCYKKKGKARGTHRAAERVDASGACRLGIEATDRAARTPDRYVHISFAQVIWWI